MFVLFLLHIVHMPDKVVSRQREALQLLLGNLQVVVLEPVNLVK